ncbi:spore photoproduct lyase [Clostridium sp. LY3-2]|uniref:spore photoproduct lyase n=1 Tax=Clostridium sp. LY3-2 TaxID=2942482 RepID=UPI00215219B2|nr:spore photoproduct lyase [Clostridium sp. LY3-2]MCR6515134.1 spore photoproduct lyase [Clostridium sp. LY3-2]
MFIPNRIIFNKGALDYDIGKEVYEKFKEDKNIEIIKSSNNRIKEYIKGENTKEYFFNGKKTLVLGVKGKGKFQSCKPSANYQLPLLSGCMGECEYCYLNTNLSDKPYIKVNVNISDILDKAKEYINERKPEITIFEGAATSDPLPVEPYTKILSKTIEFFSKEEFGRFRFVTKYNFVDSLLSLNHNGHTEIRFTLNTEKIINQYENKTASLEKRIKASKKVLDAGYKIGYVIAPVFIYENFKEDYKNLLLKIKEEIKDYDEKITFEIISHRYTLRAKEIINEVYENNNLPMNEELRSFKFGQFGYGKYLYKKEDLKEIKEFFKDEISKIFNNYEILYII